MKPIDLKTRDQVTIETALPSYMMLMMLEECAKIGIIVRQDALHHLANATKAPLARLDALSISRCAKRLDDTAKELLRELNPNDPREGLYVCAMFALCLAEENRIDDKTNMAVLVSLLLMEDVKNDEPDVHGFRPVWMVNEKRWKGAAGTMMNRAMIMGLYPKPLQLQLTA